MRISRVSDLRKFLEDVPDTAPIAIASETEDEWGKVTHRQWWGISDITYKEGEGVRIR
jgi:hypothetical protein